MNTTPSSWKLDLLIISEAEEASTYPQIKTLGKLDFLLEIWFSVGFKVIPKS